MAGLGVSPGTSPGVSRPGRSQSRPDGAFRKDRRSLLCTLSTASLLLAFPLPSEALSRAQQKAYDAFVVAPPQPVTSAQVQKQREDRVRQSFQVEEGRIQVALRLYTDAVQDQREGRYQEALSKYEQIIRNYGDFALAERSRVSRAILEYQLGSVDAAILHLKDEEVALRGGPLCAGGRAVRCQTPRYALSAQLSSVSHSDVRLPVRYAEKPYELSQAEEQFEIAMEFDKRFMDASYVRDGKPAWPPRMVLALEKFRSFGR